MNHCTNDIPSPHHGWAPRVMALVAAGLVVLGLSARDAAAQQRTGGRDITTASDEGEVRKRARIRMELASAYYTQGQMTTALDEVKQALVADPGLPGAYNLRGLIYDALGNDGLAEESFSTALRQDAQDGSAMHNYAWFLCRRKQFERADDLFGQALSLPRYRDAAQTLLVRGVCQSRAGRWDDAEKTLTRAYELDAGNPATATNLSYTLYRRGEYERARFYIRRVNGSQELSNAQTLWLAARIEHRLGNVSGRDDLGNQLHTRYPSSREAAAFERKQFED
ncbi:MAG: type IV pilus biogenesis/stability protein PilW [Aquabacterium sp.]|nr:MAG: type IV pilus biogenesis/stability protein PilW [Aquabacterium sp.]